jgi:hypothetical protein
MEMMQPHAALAQVQEPGGSDGEARGGRRLGQWAAMTTFTMRRVGGDFVVTGPDIEPKKFKTRREGEIVPLRKRPTGEGTASGSG